MDRTTRTKARTMIKPRFEIFRKNGSTLGVVAKHPGVFNRLQIKYNRYPEDSRYKRGEEVLFWVPEGDRRILMKILRIKALPEIIE